MPAPKNGAPRDPRGCLRCGYSVYEAEKLIAAGRVSVFIFLRLCKCFFLLLFVCCCCLNIVRITWKCLKEICVINQILVRFSSDSHQILVRFFSDSPQILLRFSSDSRQILVRFLSDSRQILIRFSSDFRQIFVSFSLDSRQILVTMVFFKTIVT